MKSLMEKLSRDPYADHLGISIDKVEKGYARCSAVIEDYMLNFLGYVHGGMIFSLADVAFSAASNSDYSPSVALDVSGSFLKTVNVGDRIQAEGRLVHTTKRTGLYRMEVTHGDDLIATFNGTVFRIVK
jgi:acyl-CoA thioesterase